MICSTKQLCRNALGLESAGHTLKIRAADPFMVSYPRRHDDVDSRDNIVRPSGPPTTAGSPSLCGSLKKLRS
jgi:hypothetical protein